MNFNYGYERRLFEQDQAKKRKAYLAAGMTEEAIQSMYEYDLYVFNNNRKEIKHRAHYSEMLSYDAETGDSHYMDMDEFPAKESRLPYSYKLRAWLEEIENKKLYRSLCSFSDDYIAIIAMKMDGYTDEDIGKILHVKRPAISNKLGRIKKILRNFI